MGSTWVFKCKRLPDGTIQKLKARFCVQGDLQKTDITKDDVFAPVIDWATVHLLFTLSVACNLEMAQIDFCNAFVQSTLPEPIYLELPLGGFHKNKELAGKVLKVNKSLYGDRRHTKRQSNASAGISKALSPRALSFNLLPPLNWIVSLMLILLVFGVLKTNKILLQPALALVSS